MVNTQTNPPIKSLAVADFAAAFGELLSAYVEERIRAYAFEYTEFSPAEKEGLLIKVVETLLDPNLLQSGEHRLDQWELGWGENLELILHNPGNIDLIVPKYFNKYGAIRWRGDFIRPISEKFECHSLAIILDWLFDKYLRQASAIYEFGCGTGHNLLRARGVNEQASLYGLDWTVASQRIIENLARHQIDPDIHGHRFDYFNPDQDFQLAENAVVYTVASLEQIGSRWEPFLNYLLKNRPKLCIHIEPIAELLDESKLIDYLSVAYFKKRNYLNGFLDGLRQLEQIGQIKIHKAQRTYIGSLFIEGYSIIVWSPV
ncbi:hypothetical protein [Methylomonas sp. AM2-LC]|uniref:hypothetical protein n=1 Tax=Methylomonas sp. AM2-LC TaxID=3153301 RepID=UPI0032655C8C